ncbi:MAG TPA: CHRD domain-containing protein [Nitrososphaeraceae archaeon]|nr:CHRD domain-containing protein [Nitrososphaeraceae archaeon]
MKYYVLITSFLIIVSLISFTPIFADEKRFSTPLTGMEEVPPVNTNSTGLAIFDFKNNDLNFKINVTNLDNIKGAHIHNGAFGQNGDVIVTLFNPEKPTNIVNGTLVEGNINASSLQGSIKGKTINVLVQMMNNTQTYVNIHTEQYPNGEIRGQITSINATNFGL